MADLLGLVKVDLEDVDVRIGVLGQQLEVGPGYLDDLPESMPSSVGISTSSPSSSMLLTV